MSLRHALVITVLLFLAQPLRAADRIGFWNTPQFGANCFNESPPDAAYFRALRSYGATWTRLAFSKWKSPHTRDFLFGSLDDYQALVPEDLATLRKVLDTAQAEGIAVVLTPLELPGARWVQLNDGKFDDRLWSDRRYWRQAAAFWRDLAAALADHPAIVAYNFVNEPVPEKKGGLAEHSPAAVMRAWYAQQRGGTRDLHALYEMLAAAVREVDPKTPLMLDGGFYAAADALEAIGRPLADPRALYAYHMYEPWLATSTPNLKARVPYRYPGVVPFGGSDVDWDAARVAAYLQQPLDWAKAHGVPVNRLVAAEFGCVRLWADCPRYLEDVLSALDDDGVHWAFYSFRESWDGMDYELGADKLPWQYWQAMEAGKPFALKRGPNKVFEPIERRLRRRAPNGAGAAPGGH
jgi:cellulase (glycosyl hydrolase family 5)